MLVAVPGIRPAPLATLGAKAYSLQRLAAWGLQVPPAIVLTPAFFQPWLDALRTLPSWQAWQAAPRDAWPALCDSIKADALALPLTALQTSALGALQGQLPPSPHMLYAVRSSATEEDLESASFAGLYETELGVPADRLEPAIRRCFAACLDARVALYKAARGMPAAPAGMALIVQVQLDSEVAGVGFSINPLTNDYDEAVFEANWGLGESVVAGLATPDHFVVDKPSGKVTQRRLGAKQSALSLGEGGGTRAAPDLPRPGFCLTDARLAELNAALLAIETEAGFPVDIEWAYAGAALFILQARAIASYVPLEPAMLTAPGQARRLYMDIALSKGMTSNAPISPMGLSWLAGDMALMLEHATGKARFSGAAPDGLLYLGGGRMYMNLSHLLCFASPAKLARGNAATDQLMADTIAGIDASRYRSARRPAWIWPALSMLPGILWRLRRVLWRMLRALIAPHSTSQMLAHTGAAFEARHASLTDHALPLADFQRKYGAPAIAQVIEADMPALALGVMATTVAQKLARARHPEDRILTERLARGLPGNVVVDMGMRMHRMAATLDVAHFDDIAALAARVKQRALPPDFLQQWDDFLARYGGRGPGEMDIANAHYADDHAMLLRQMGAFARGGAFDPQVQHAQLVAQREQAYYELMARFGPMRRAILLRAYRLITLFSGSRDTPKLHNLMYQHAVRSRLLHEGAQLVTRGRLDAPEHIFHLTLPDLVNAEQDPAFELRALVARNAAFAHKLASCVHSFPAVIDSRGRIARPPARDDAPGELRGMAVSPGVASGRVVLLRNAHEKSIEPGDVLVAFTTDPGWTPLFVNAAAIVLEVGGVLQHGAVVAREYGKPCVVGIADVMHRLTDGQMVEVDGTEGIVRLTDEKSAAARKVSTADRLKRRQ